MQPVYAGSRGVVAHDGDDCVHVVEVAAVRRDGGFADTLSVLVTQRMFITHGSVGLLGH